MYRGVRTQKAVNEGMSCIVIACLMMQTQYMQSCESAGCNLLYPLEDTQHEIHPKAGLFQLQDSLAQLRRAAGSLKGRQCILLQSL